MGAKRADRTLILITGPVAAGKSTTARLLARRLRDLGDTVSVIDLDRVYLMQDETFASEAAWRGARIGAGVLARFFFDAGANVVVVDGGLYARHELDEILERVQEDVRVAIVTLNASFELTLERATLDPDPGRIASRVPETLRGLHERFRRAFAFLADVSTVIDTDGRSSDELAAVIATLIDASGS